MYSAAGLSQRASKVADLRRGSVFRSFFLKASFEDIIDSGLTRPGWVLAYIL